MNRWKVPLNKPFFSDETKELVMNVLNSRMVSQGEMVEQFEEEVRKYVGAKYALAVSSCTAGMWMILCYLKGDEPGFDSGCARIPAFTFPAARNCALYNDMMVIDDDVDINTYNMEPETTSERFCKEDIIIPIHQFGMPCDMDRMNEVAHEADAFVLEDAACALGSKYKGKMIGSEGTAVFSFHGRKILTTGEGGMIVTDDEELYEQCLLMRQFGRSKTGKFEGHGLNFKMSDVAAAMGIAQIQHVDRAIRKRHTIANEYDKRVGEIEIDEPYMCVGEEYQTNYQSYVIDLEPMKRSRNWILHNMRNAGIEVQVGSYDQSHGACKNSAQLARTTLALPIWPEMTLEDIDMVINALEEALT